MELCSSCLKSGILQQDLCNVILVVHVCAQVSAFWVEFWCQSISSLFYLLQVTMQQSSDFDWTRDTSQDLEGQKLGIVSACHLDLVSIAASHAISPVPLNPFCSMPLRLLDQNEANHARQHQGSSVWNSHLHFPAVSFQPASNIIPDSALAGHPSSPHVPPACSSLRCSQLLGPPHALYARCWGREL